MGLQGIASAIALAAAAILSLPGEVAAQNISLEALRRSGYGVVELKRPRPNVLTVTADIDGRKVRLLVDTGWTGEGVALHGGGATPGNRAERVLIGNVQLTQVPLTVGRLGNLGTETSRRTIGAQGVVGAGFLRTCSAVLDLQNLRLYLRPPGKGQRVVLGPALQATGMAEIPFELTGARECLVEVEVNGFRGRMLIDTGSYHAAVDRRLASEIKARPIVTRAGHRRPQTSDEFESITRMDKNYREVAELVRDAPMTPLQSFRIGGVKVRAPDIRLRRVEAYSRSRGRVIGELGMDILGPNGAVIDFREQKLYVLPARG